MILVDTSVWVNHFRVNMPPLVQALHGQQVFIHSFVLGELALGNFQQRQLALEALGGLPFAQRAEDDEVLGYIERHGLAGRGLGYIDVHLLSSTVLTPGTQLWTQDKRLHQIAHEQGVAFAPTMH